ncbi:hypothetical protein Tco_1014462 [Tanacetum coccineum]
MTSLAKNVLTARAENQPPMLEKGGYDTWQSPNAETGREVETRMQTLKDLTCEERIRRECDIQAANIILHGLTKVTKQERESKLADKFDRFTSEKGETIQSYYMRFLRPLYDINIIGLDMNRLQVNTKFVNHLEPEQSRFVKWVKQARNLHEVSFDQLYAYLKQNELDVNEVRAMKARFPDPLALIANTYNPLPFYSSYKSLYNP